MVKKVYSVWGIVVVLWLTAALSFGWQTSGGGTGHSTRGSTGIWVWGGGK